MHGSDCECGSGVHIYQHDKDQPVYTRRTLLAQGAAAMVAGGAALLGTREAGAQAAAPATSPGATPAPTANSFATPNFRKGVVFWGAGDPGVTPSRCLPNARARARPPG